VLINMTRLSKVGMNEKEAGYNVTSFDPDKIQKIKEVNGFILGFRGPWFVVYGPGIEPEYYATDTYAERVLVELAEQELPK